MSRHIKEQTRCILWGRSAGRCEFRGCNADLTRHPETKELVNIAEAAHIIGFSKNGPRGEAEITEELANSIENLMLICRVCHKTIDTNIDNYPVELLREMKKEHEFRVSQATSIDADRKSHIVLYGARVGENNSPLSLSQVIPAMIPEWYPAETNSIQLGIQAESLNDSEAEYWINQERHLRRQVNTRIKARVDFGEINHLSVFA